MTRTLDFPPELENRLQVLAAQHGTSVEAFVLHAVELAATEPTGGETMEALYARSFDEGGELTAFSDAQEDIYEYSAGELAAMAGGEFERPLR
jgi:plasmid stability protein